jgi:NAD(P)-dependent dehydrogenase (short-subunit alcohol dehydrogenase family)
VICPVASIRWRNFGKLHIACNNAGVAMHGNRIVDVPPGDWEFVIGVNIWGIIHGIRVRTFLGAHQPMRAAAQ